MDRILICLFVISLFLCITETVNASVIEFVPPNDPTGQVYSSDNNDSYNLGRGMVFEIQSDTTIDSIGIYHDLTGVDLSFYIASTLSRTGDVATGQTILMSGHEAVSTDGLEWIDFSFSPITLLAGNYYHFSFIHNGSGNQNFYYNQFSVPTFDQNDFLFIDGTHFGNTGNFLIPALRLNTVNTTVPEPATMALFGLGGAGLSFIRRKKLA